MKLNIGAKAYTEANHRYFSKTKYRWNWKTNSADLLFTVTDAPKPPPLNVDMGFQKEDVLLMQATYGSYAFRDEGGEG